MIRRDAVSVGVCAREATSRFEAPAASAPRWHTLPGRKKWHGLACYDRADETSWAQFRLVLSVRYRDAQPDSEEDVAVRFLTEWQNLQMYGRARRHVEAVEQKFGRKWTQ